ncbi:prostatic spermine-binding protein-like isoform X2 [Cyclopterus lumpus]|uniref:prostatic spermine-binding protein-like isoform X2 n=1 Tax=Cyclopterus lumpus TaxID=8103 RepID=UPI001486A90B|nr:prostatic spermine-binding protein-like isoform X2 [Cyclopterus lumpus]
MDCRKRDMVEDAVKKALGMEDKDEEKDEGGVFSKIFNRDDDDDDKKKKRKSSEKDDDDDKKESFFSKIFDRDDDDNKEKDSKSGFSGLFSELEGAASAGDNGGGAEERGGATSSVQVNDGDLFDDLMDVAEETAREK